MTTSTLLIEGSFPELAEELAQYLDSLSEGAGILASIEGDLNSIREAESQESDEVQSIQKSKDDVLKKIITKATVLNAAPERGKKPESTKYPVLTLHRRVFGRVQPVDQSLPAISYARTILCTLVSISFRTTCGTEFAIWSFPCHIHLDDDIQRPASYK